METIILQRTELGDLGTPGEFIRNGSHLCFTIERPWLDNQRKISCIPPGRYYCKPYSSPKFPSVWEICGVPDRDLILIHAANTMLDLEGCVGVGQQRGILRDHPAVLGSKATMSMLRMTLPREFLLDVRNPV